MGSRIVHMCIANKIMSLDINLNERRFIVGNLAPDAHKTNKAASHFELVNQNEILGRYLDFNAFLDKYGDKILDSFYLGYLCHLIMDEFWYNDIYKVYVDCEVCNEAEKLRDYYDDLRTLNSILIRRYNLKYNIDYFNDFTLDEIDKNRLKDILSESKHDFSPSAFVVNRKLKYLAEDTVFEHIENSTNVILNSLINLGIKLYSTS